MLFDIDGTILLTAGAGRRAIIAALRDEVGDPAAFERIRFDGKTDPQIVAEMLAAAGSARPSASRSGCAACASGTSGLLARELERPTTRTTLMPGVEPLLDRLERSRRRARPAHRQPGRGRRAQAALRRDRSRRASASAPTAPTPPTGRRCPRSPRAGPSRSSAGSRAGAEVVIIGDTPADIHCGAGISARAVAVATGAYSVAELPACGPHAVFEDLSDTERVLEAILGEMDPHRRRPAVHRELELKAVVPDPGAAPRAAARGRRGAAVQRAG